MHTLYVFCRRVDDAVDENHSDELAHQLLNGLQAGLDNHPDQPLWNALHWVRKNWEMPRRWFDELIAGARSDIGPVRIQTYDELQQYCYRVAGTVGLMTLHVMDCPDSDLYPVSLSMARAFQITNILRDLAEDHDRDRCYLPEAWLREAEAVEDWERATMSEGLRSVLRRLARRARFNFRRCRRLFYAVPGRFRIPLAVMAASYGQYFQTIQRADFPDFDFSVNSGLISMFRGLLGLVLIPMDGYDRCLPTS